ncbi:MAG: hypothetical protein RLO17_19765 [Cyclobacteriaceae bacterium]
MMKINLIIGLVLLLSCKPATNEQTSNLDSTGYKLQVLGQQELRLLEVYQETETMLINEFEIGLEDLNEKMQLLINERALPTPVIYIETDSGTAVKYLSYELYKQYRENNAIDTTKEFLVKVNLETSWVLEGQKPLDSGILNLLTEDR